MDERIFELPSMDIEIRFEVYNKFHPNNLPKIIYRTANYDKLAEALHSYFMNIYYNEYYNNGRIKVDEKFIKNIAAHVYSAIRKYENINNSFIASCYDYDVEHSIVNYNKDNEFSIDIDDNIYFELKWLLRDLQRISNSYKWDRYNVYATLYYV